MFQAVLSSVELGKVAVHDGMFARLTVMSLSNSSVTVFAYNGPVLITNCLPGQRGSSAYTSLFFAVKNASMPAFPGAGFSVSLPMSYAVEYS